LLALLALFPASTAAQYRGTADTMALQRSSEL